MPAGSDDSRRAASGGRRRLVLGLFGLALGALFLWIALRGVDVAAMRAALRRLDPVLVVLSFTLYWSGLYLRVLRWQTLLCQLGAVARRAVAETLIVGYAVNNLLPARLGELFRADYAKRRFGLSRTAVLGSIVIERLADLAAILGCLVAGVLATGMLGDVAGLGPQRLLAIGGGAALLCLVGVLLLRRGLSGPLRLPTRLLRVCADLVTGLRSLNRATLARTALLTVAIWGAEVTALWAMVAALGPGLTPAQALFVMSTASLSTLVPTAPGYLGTYQLVFGTAMAAFGSSALLGVLASTLIQACLFGSVTLAGCVLYLLRSMHTMRPIRTEALLSGSDIRSR